MKKLTIVSSVLLIVLCFCACAIPAKKPTEGIWYCEELKISIDFGLHHSAQTNQCAEYHNDDGTTTGILTRIDYGNGIGIVSADQRTSYLIGKFVYRKDTFTVTRNSDGKEFVFRRIENSSTGDGTVCSDGNS